MKNLLVVLSKLQSTWCFFVKNIGSYVGLQLLRQIKKDVQQQIKIIFWRGNNMTHTEDEDNEDQMTR